MEAFSKLRNVDKLNGPLRNDWPPCSVLASFCLTRLNEVVAIIARQLQLAPAVAQW